ncbi:hypothetical protein CC1G_00113 [Coprinopsis cinerea okayama7|uniref:Uncharacterized protein n=1 Tax=Coprinopsis cinerea (strain Okayama-7 / 130 / ATCC MYA-4618 / FGSC 9003) TaxID=240176 RepID=A8NWT0_COPC7|nr:hypothetical protein CC1G_00113 [Coprinopsis cinerea okayama7\|eukprot:XP_001836977.1 hypothetical protein CC1G_00113 [Coprinopsis cinerea okayama7\
MASSSNSEVPTGENPLESFFNNILKPGSSLQPTFLAIVDGAFAVLLVILLSLAFLTSGNPHIFALIFIELALWASVKWFVNELKKMPPAQPQGGDGQTGESKKDE